MYHINDLKRFVQCPHLYFFSLQNNEEKRHFLRNDEKVNDLLLQYLKIDDYFLGHTGDSNDVFFTHENSYRCFSKVRFEDHGLRIKVPLMIKGDKGYVLYFVYNGTSIKELDFLYYTIVYEVLKNLNIVVSKVILVYFNKDYCFDGSLDVSKLFILTDIYKNSSIIDILSEEFIDYLSIMNQIENYDQEKNKAVKKRVCHKRGQCPYYFECFKEELSLPDDSVLTLVSSHDKQKLYEDGIVHLKDINLANIDINRVQYGQIMASKLGGLFYDKAALKIWLDSFKGFPITYLDFEWDTYLVPEFEKMHPLNVLCFEFVLYILDENGNLNNYSFVGNGDCRKDFIEALLEKIPTSGPILAYNAMGAEMRRLEEFAQYFPEYESKIKQINSRFIDLSSPFVEGLVYDTRFRGNFTLKRIVDVISKYNYQDLEISDGLNAVYKWRELDLGLQENKEKIIHDLIEYCGLDAYGLYLVHKWLLKLVR